MVTPPEAEMLAQAIEAIATLKTVIAFLILIGFLLWFIPSPEYCQQCGHCRGAHAEKARQEKITRHKLFHTTYPFIERGDTEHCPYCAEGSD